jgi:RNA polymerase sigma factor (sigma-70 family)
MPVVRLSKRLWAEHVHQVRSLAAMRVAAKRRAVIERARVEELVAAHLPRIRRIARQVWRVMTHLEVSDLVQTGIVGLLEADRRYHPGAGNFDAFSYFRIHGAMIDAHNRRRYRDETHSSIAEIETRLGYMPAHLDTDPAPLPDELVGRLQKARVLARAIDLLPIDERRVILAALAGATLPDTAAECGRSIAWARAKLVSARGQLAGVVQSRAA